MTENEIKNHVIIELLKLIDETVRIPIPELPLQEMAYLEVYDDHILLRLHKDEALEEEIRQAVLGTKQLIIELGG